MFAYVHIYIYEYIYQMQQRHSPNPPRTWYPSSFHIPILNSPKPQHNVVHAVRTTKHVQRLALLAIKHECPTGDMGISKNGGFSSQIIHFNRVFSYFHHPFWGTLISGNTHICFPKLTPKKPGGFRWYKFFFGRYWFNVFAVCRLVSGQWGLNSWFFRLSWDDMCWYQLVGFVY